MELDIFRGSDVVAKIPVGGKNGRFTHGLMNAHKIVVNDVKQYDALQVQLDDYVIRKGIKFKINTVPDLNIDDQLSYNITFEGPKYTWHDKLFMDEGEADIPDYYGNALLLMQLFLANINEIDPGWSLGEIADTPEKHLVFSNVTCHEAIILIAEEFELEFQEKIKVIDMIPKIGRDTNLSFEYGMGKGLYNLTRTYVSDKNVVTKVYGFGGDRNIPVGYRPGKGRPKLRFNPGYHTHNTDLYGIKEGQYTNPDIIPEREAAVTGVTFGNPLSTITDTTLNFNIKDCVIEGLEPKIGFTSGLLSGEEFVITDYNPTTKTITYKGFINNNNVVLPNDAFRAAVGDKYVLYDIELPASYVTAKEAEIDAETLQYVIENSVPRVEYGGTIDPIHMRDNSIELLPGDRVNFKDARIGLDATIRITEISMPLDFPEVISDETSIEITIANFVTYSAQQRLRDEKLIQKHEVKKIDIRSVEQARRNSANLLNVRDYIIDPATGKLITENIVEGSISALYLSIGAKATNFSLKNIAFNTNAAGNPNAFTASVGQLIHYDIKIEGIGFVWEMQPYSTITLNPANAYYLFAKVSRATLVGSWVLSTDIKSVESEVGFFNLQAGVLFPVKDGRRDYELTKGMTFIIGDQITAGVLRSLDGLNFFNLNEGTFKLGDDVSGLDYGVTTPKRLTIRGGITQNAGGITAPITLFRGPYMPLVTYYSGDSVSFSGSKYVYTYPTPIFNVIPTNTTYWTLEVSKGDTGEKGIDGLNGSNGTPGTPGAAGNYTEFRFAKNGSTTVPPLLPATETNPSGWFTSQPALGPAEYAYITSAVKTSAGVLVSNWTIPIRYTAVDGANGTPGAPGANGPAGSTGPHGPFMNFRGDFDPGKSYVGYSTNIQCVKYLGSYYITRTDAGTIPSGTLPTDSSKWNPFGGQFESLATGLLLAELAYVKNLGVENLKTANSGRRVEITKEGNNLSFYVEGSSSPSLQIDANISAGDGVASAGISIITAQGSSYITGSGIVSNGSRQTLYPGTAGIESNMSAAFFLNRRNTSSDGISAAVGAWDQTTASNGVSKSFALFSLGGSCFNGAMFYIPTLASTSRYDCLAKDSHVIAVGSAGSIYLPVTSEKVYDGRKIVVVNNTNSGSGITVFTNGEPINLYGVNISSIAVGSSRTFIFYKAFNSWFTYT